MRALAARLLAALVLLAGAAGGALAACTPVDFLALALPAPGDTVRQALETAYPGARLDRGAGVFVTPDGIGVPFAGPRDVGAADRLNDATIGDQFVFIYPLAFDLQKRRTPFEDPGRLRNDTFFRALYFDSKATARASLTTVRFEGRTRTTRFSMTTKHCVDAQLAAALDEIEALSPAIDVFFANSGGSFNWRTIAGTDRLSVHSFGIAVDLNSELGGYWRWSGAAQGQAVDYDNRIPPEIVAAFERYGFIWGGKWHHFDGMHFEYRPELIVHARLEDG